MKATRFAYRSHCSTNILQWETQSPFTKTEMGRHWEMNKNFKAHVVKWIKSPWAVANVHPKRTWRSYNRQPVARTKNTLLQLVMEKVTHQIQMRTSLLMPEVFKEFDPLLSKTYEVRHIKTTYEVFIVGPVTPQDILATIPKHLGY